MFEDGYITANGLRLHYVSVGRGDLILFLHGFPEFWYAWKNQPSEFGKDHRAMALDLPGYNLSEKPKEVLAYEAGHIVECVGAFARELSPAKKFALVAHDWGGYIAWALAIAYPEVLRGLVIIFFAGRRPVSVECENRSPHTRNLGHERSGALTPEPRRAGTICDATCNPPHSRRIAVKIW